MTSIDKGNIVHIVTVVDAWNDGVPGYNTGSPLKETSRC